MEYPNLVYDFAGRLPRWEPILFPLVFVAAGIGVYFYCRKYMDPKKVDLFGINKRKHGLVFGSVFASLAGLVWIVITFFTLKEYFNTKKIYVQRSFSIVEGRVRNFHPVPAGGHDSEKFDVAGVHFELSDYDAGTYGYNNAASHGGVIREDLAVRIGYFNNGDKNVIVKLETE